jgi:cell pole-organizing protein PopZ
MTPPQPQGTATSKPGTDKPGDPSMEDILASIRRILSEDEGKASSSASPASAASAAPAEPDAGAEDILMLDASMLVEAPPGVVDAPASAQVAPHEAVDPPPGRPAADSPPVPAEPATPDTAVFRPAPAEPPGLDKLERFAGDHPAESLVAPEAAAAAATSVSSLLRHLQSERHMAVHRGGPTIEDIVREEMRPLLKHWLDTNLPPLVERLVRAEIERVVARSVS